jgi:hypothetical protein
MLWTIIGWIAAIIIFIMFWGFIILLIVMAVSGTGGLIQTIVCGIKNHIAKNKRLEYLEAKELASKRGIK